MALFCATNFRFGSFTVQEKAIAEVVEKAESAKIVTTNDVKASTQIKAEKVGEYVSPTAGGGKSQLVALL